MNSPPCQDYPPKADRSACGGIATCFCSISRRPACRQADKSVKLKTLTHVSGFSVILPGNPSNY